MSVKTNRNGSKATTQTTRNQSSKLPVPTLAEATDQLYVKCYQLRQEGKLRQELRNYKTEERSLPYNVRVMLAEETAEEAAASVTLQLPVWVYGHLCAAAKVTGTTIEETLVSYLEDNINEWANDSYFLSTIDYLATDPETSITAGQPQKAAN